MACMPDLTVPNGAVHETAHQAPKRRGVLRDPPVLLSGGGVIAAVMRRVKTSAPAHNIHFPFPPFGCF